MSYRSKLTISFLSVILLTVLVTLLVQRAAIEPRWTEFMTSFSLQQKGPELAAIVAQNLQKARNWFELRSLLEELSSLFREKIFLTDANGELRVQSRYPEEINPVESEIDKALEGLTTSGEALLPGGKKADVVTSPVFMNNKLVAVIQIVQEKTPLGGMFSFPLMSSLLIGGVVAGALSLFVVYLVSRQVTLPIFKMKQMALKFSQGDFSARVNIPSRDELGELASILNNMAQKLENTEKIRKELLANISHELRTPLTTVQGYLEALIDSVIPEEKEEESLRLVLEEVKRTEGLVDSILELSRLEAGAIKMESMPFDLRELILKTREKFSLPFQRKRVSLECLLGDGSVVAVGDRERIKEVLEIILDNALHYTMEGGKVAVSCIPEKNTVEVSVTDTGVGIAPEELPRIFDRFYRSKRVLSGERLGAGLGLAIAKEIVEAHGSRLRVESTLGKGSCFRFTLNLKEE